MKNNVILKNSLNDKFNKIINSQFFDLKDFILFINKFFNNDKDLSLFFLEEKESNF